MADTEAVAPPRNGWCPECGCTMTGPHMFGEFVCDDPDCAYIMWKDEE